jgi:HEAT repeat protein
MHIQAPEFGNVTALRDIYQDRNHPQDTRDAALLTMASCAEKLSDDESRPYLDLLKAESRTEEPHQLKLVLAALGNYGKDEAIDALIPFVGAMEEDVSILALEALAGINSRRAVDTLLGNVLSPQSRMAERQSALQSIQKSAYQVQNDDSYFNDLLAGYR